MITYVDTSTLIKLIIDETGSEVAASLWDQSEVVAATRVLLVEARAALAAAQRGGRLTPAQHRTALADLTDLWGQIAVVEVNQELIATAAELAERHGLRGYDAVHLAAAKIVAADVFTSADRTLCDAATREGLHIANPLHRHNSDDDQPTPGTRPS